MATLLLTGMTGTVMAPLATVLLNRGHTIVALVRPTKDCSADARLAAVACPTHLRENLYVLPGDLREPLAGVSIADQDTWHGKIDKIVHGAASIRFYDDPQDRAVWHTNVDGTRHLLDLAAVLHVREFHHVSTAYVAGDAPIFTEAELDSGQTARNDYEASKRQAEKLVRQCPSGQTSIYRIPIVVGDARTGAIRSFTGYYGFFSAFWDLRAWLLDLWRTRECACRKAGIRVAADQTIAIPLFIPCSEGPLNLVPIDWLLPLMADLVEMTAEGKTFHLTNPHPPTVRYTIEESLALLGFRGVLCGHDRLRTQPVGITQVVQRAIDRGIDIYRPYILKEYEHFDNAVLIDTLRRAGKLWTPLPVFDRTLFQTLLTYAVSQNFKRAALPKTHQGGR